MKRGEGRGRARGLWEENPQQTLDRNESVNQEVEVVFHRGFHMMGMSEREHQESQASTQDGCFSKDDKVTTRCRAETHVGLME